MTRDNNTFWTVIAFLLGGIIGYKILSGTEMEENTVYVLSFFIACIGGGIMVIIGEYRNKR